ncbi:hypothetical protein EDC94DRAFT_590561 [Helicostylum pulchrum]|nr:hypothetical protein EDC94DRAFT_590561 [Helicostylum pulchrum]
MRRDYRDQTRTLQSQQPLPLHPPAQIREIYDTRRTVVSYGDASISSTYRKHTLIPVKPLLAKLLSLLSMNLELPSPAVIVYQGLKTFSVSVSSFVITDLNQGR